MARDVLIRVLEERREAIIKRWTQEVVSSSPRYASRPEEEIAASANEMLNGLGAALSSGDYSTLFEFLNRIVSVRSSMGFKLAEVQRVVNIGSGIIIDELRSMCGIAEKEECFDAVRRLLEVMYWASMNLGDTFEEIRSKEFTAGTLIALGAAQQDMDEKEVLRKSLDLAMSLMRCSHGAIAMHHLGGCVVMVPTGDRRLEDLFVRLSGRVTRGKKSVMIHGRDIEELVSPIPGSTGFDLVCAAGIPIRARGKIIGSLLLGSTSERALSSHEMGFLEAVASQIGLASDNARMIQQIMDREQFIKKEHGELMTMMNELGAMVYVADMETYELLAANRPVTNAFGRDIIGRKCYEVLQTNRSEPCDFCTNEHLVQDGKPAGPYVWLFQNTRSGRWFRCLDRAVYWPDGRLVRLEIALDVTDMETAKSRLEEIGVLTGLYNDILVHDVRNYAGAAKAFIQMLVDPTTPEAKRAEMAETALRQMEKTDLLVDRISKLVKAQSREHQTLETMDLALLLDDAVSDVSATDMGSRTEFRREYEKGKCYVQLGEFAPDIFVNVVSNAVKYGEGKPVTVSISSSTLRDRPAWQVSVIDEGQGVPPDKKARLFERYVRLPTMSQIKGQGLGLTIVKTLTGMYGGAISLEDRITGDHTKGAVFTLTFPKTPAAQ